MRDWAKDLIGKLISDDKPEKVSALLALVSGFTLVLSTLILIIATVCVASGVKFLAVLTLLITGIIGLANFNKH